jgi:hypothetical protein
MIVFLVGIASTRTPPSQSQKTVILTLHTDRDCLNFFFWEDKRLHHSMDCLFFPVQVSSAVTVWDKVSLWALKYANKLEEMTFHVVLCLTVGLQGMNIKDLE